MIFWAPRVAAIAGCLAVALWIAAEGLVGLGAIFLLFAFVAGVQAWSEARVR